MRVNCEKVFWGNFLVLPVILGKRIKPFFAAVTVFLGFFFFSDI